jgi:chromate transporter
VTALVASAAIGITKIALGAPDFIDRGNLSDILKKRNAALFVIIFFLIKKYKRHPVFYIGGAVVFCVIMAL